MTTITFLGGGETGNMDHNDWGSFHFPLNVPVECDDQHIIAKARTNRFFKVEGGDAGKVKVDAAAQAPAKRPPGRPPKAMERTRVPGSYGTQPQKENTPMAQNPGQGQPGQGQPKPGGPSGPKPGQGGDKPGGQ